MPDNEIENMYKELIDKIDMRSELDALLAKFRGDENGFLNLEFKTASSSQAVEEWKPR